LSDQKVDLAAFDIPIGENNRFLARAAQVVCERAKDGTLGSVFNRRSNEQFETRDTLLVAS
jgi:hypothetical protein